MSPGVLTQENRPHQDNKGIQRKVQELQTLYLKASDFLCNSVSDLQDDNIANGATALPSQYLFCFFSSCYIIIHHSKIIHFQVYGTAQTH
ncbi:uncharacterized protein VP01_2352g4 [Puccinia sorghi]|uniref:Uncharacterized protein n=1 Tax=Puccinia sorghi TaxID=27349 RepID=A0A0L6V775_9BASI|nr:uncharacterized protein VP01_2352g4 [Puccinia sorghi]